MYPVTRRYANVLVALVLSLCAVVAYRVPAQTSPAASGIISGYVTDSAGTPLAGATARVLDTRVGALTGTDGRYRIDGAPAGSRVVVVTYVGFVPDSSTVVVMAGRTVTLSVRMRGGHVVELQRVVVVASPRLSETKAAALARQQNADNIVSVLSGD